MSKKRSSARKFYCIIGRRNGEIRCSVHGAYFHEADPKPPHTKSLCNAEWGRQRDRSTILGRPGQAPLMRDSN